MNRLTYICLVTAWCSFVVKIGLIPAVPCGTLLEQFNGTIVAAVLLVRWHPRLQDNFEFVGRCPIRVTWFISANIGCNFRDVGAFRVLLGETLQAVTFGCISAKRVLGNVNAVVEPVRRRRLGLIFSVWVVLMVRLNCLIRTAPSGLCGLLVIAKRD